MLCAATFLSCVRLCAVLMQVQSIRWQGLRPPRLAATGMERRGAAQEVIGEVELSVLLDFESALLVHTYSQLRKTKLLLDEPSRLSRPLFSRSSVLASNASDTGRPPNLLQACNDTLRKILTNYRCWRIA